MRHEVLRTVEEVRRLEGEWDETLARSDSDCVFLTWAWVETWLSIHDANTDLFVIVVRDDADRLVGVAPFYRTDYRLLGTVPYVALRILGDTDSGAEYLSWFVDRDNAQAANAEMVAALRAAVSQWDFIWLPKQSNWSGFPSQMISALESGGLTVRERPCDFSTVALPDDFDTFMGRMPSGRRQQIRRMGRKILGATGVEIRRVEAQEDLEPALEALFSLHGKRWQAAGEDGVFARRPGEKAFYERFAPKALQHGWLAVYQVLDQGTPKAVQFGYVYNGAFLQLQEGFDPGYQSHTGNVLRAFVIEDCIAAGLHEYDFLGGITEHKRRWLAEVRKGSDLMILKPSLKNLPITAIGLWPTGAYLKSRRHGRNGSQGQA